MDTLMKFIIALALTLVFLRGCGSGRVIDSPLLGQPAVEVTLTTVDGEEVSLSRARNGRPAVVFFWATWCPHCRTQLKALSERKQEIEQKGITVIAVNTGERAETVTAFCDGNKIPYKIYLDPDGSAANAYQVFGIPMFFSIGQDGTVKGVGASFDRDDDERLLGG